MDIVIADPQYERDYVDDDDDEDEDDDELDDTTSLARSTLSTISRTSLHSSTSQAPPGIPRDDFDAIMDDFLDNHEVVGRRLRQSLGGNALSGVEKLRVLRAAIDDGDEGLGKEENRKRILVLEKLGRGFKRDEEEVQIDDDREKWDVETILSVSSDLQKLYRLT